MLKWFINYITYSVFGMSPESKLSGAINFFLYDSVKILLLLFFMISFIGFLRSYISQNKVKEWITKKKAFGNLYASLFGALTPFCSCSSIPIFFGFLEVGIPLGVTFSFLITSPIINEYLVIVMLGFFGWKVTSLYVLSGICIGVISGLILGRMNLDRYLVKDILAKSCCKPNNEKVYSGIKERILFGLSEAKWIIRRLWLWILLGVAMGSLIHNYVPSEAIQLSLIHI